MIFKKDRFIKKLESMSLKYHKLSFLMQELANTLKIKFKGDGQDKECRKFVKEELKIDFDKVIKQTEFFKEFHIEDFKK